MASRKRLYTPKTLEALDISDASITKALGMVSLVQEQLKVDLSDTSNADNYQGALWAVQDLLYAAKKAHDKLTEEEPIYADTLEDFLLEEQKERELETA